MALTIQSLKYYSRDILHLPCRAFDIFTENRPESGYPIKRMIHPQFRVLCALVMMIGCAGPKGGGPASTDPESEANTTTQTWRKGSYQVRFAAGPVRVLPDYRGQQGFSTYSVFYDEVDKPLHTEVAGSAMDVDVLVHSPDLNLSNYIEMWVTPLKNGC